MSDEKEAYSVKEFCKAYGISRWTLRRLHKEGKGPEVIKIGRRVIIPKKFLAKWLEENIEK